MIDVRNVMSVYSGVKNRCMCGCSGKHTYASAHRDISSKYRGYEVSDDEVSDRSVKIITNKINRAIDWNNSDAVEKAVYTENKGVQHIHVTVGNRDLVAYLIPGASVFE